MVPKLIHDNGFQFISRDFKRLDIQQIRTSRNHAETKDKAERSLVLFARRLCSPTVPALIRKLMRLSETLKDSHFPMLNIFTKGSAKLHLPAASKYRRLTA